MRASTHSRPRRRTRRAALPRALAVGVPLLVATQLLAQPAPPPPAPPPSDASTADLSAEIAKMRARLQRALTDGRRAQQNATSQKDMIKLNCINDAMVALDARARLADAAFDAFDAAAQQPGTELVGLYQAAQGDFYAAAGSSEELSSCVGSEHVDFGPDGITVKHPHFYDHPVRDCNNLGRQGCAAELELEYIGFASPFAPE